MALILAGLLECLSASPACGSSRRRSTPCRRSGSILPSGRYRARSGLGVRDVALGLIIIGFALARKPGATGAALLITSIVPIGDFVIAGKAFGYAAAARHLIALPFLVILGLVLVRK